MKVIAVTCQKYHHNRVKRINEPWGQEIEVIFLSDINEGESIIGYPDLERGYSNIWRKYVSLFREYNFIDDYYLFCDDDTFVNVNNVKEVVKKYNYSGICIGIIGKLNKDATDKDGNYTGFPLNTILGENSELPIEYPSGGAGFILDKIAIENIKDYLSKIKDDDIPRSYNGDVTIGFWLRNSNVRLINQEGFWWTNPDELKHNIEDIKKSYTYHYINEDMMLQLHKKIKN